MQSIEPASVLAPHRLA